MVEADKMRPRLLGRCFAHANAVNYTLYNIIICFARVYLKSVKNLLYLSVELDSRGRHIGIFPWRYIYLS